MKNFEIVLASHQESLAWLDYLPKKAKRKYVITVSNSGSIADVPTADRTISIPNGGREAGHYLNFIVENYDNLHPVTVFLQSDPWPHAYTYIPQLLEMFFGDAKFPDPISYLGRRYKSVGLNPTPNSIIDQILKDCWGSSSYPNGIGFSVGAQFYVTREVILAMPKEYYEKLLEAARKPDYSFGHLIEGHWGNVFQHKL
jgi:hypothetical protein